MDVQAAPVLRLKMRVSSIQTSESSPGEPVEHLGLQAVYSDQEGSANKQWSKWTPAGSLVMSISNPPAQGRVKQGDYVFVDITPTDENS